MVEEAPNPNNSKDHQDLEAQELTSLVLSQQSGDTKPTVTNDGLDYVEGQEQDPLVEQLKNMKTDLEELCLELNKMKEDEKGDLEELVRLQLNKTKEDVKTDLLEEFVRLHLNKANDDSSSNSSTEDDNGEMPISLSEDTYSLMIASKRGTRPWKVRLGIYIFQMILLIFLGLAIFAPGEW